MIPVPSTTATAELADWVEVSGLKGTTPRISQSDTVDQLRRYEVPNAEDLSASIWRELERRARVLGASYPFTVEPRRIIRRDKWTAHPVYTMLVLLSLAHQFAETRLKSYKEVSKLFERTVAFALEQYISGKAFRIGHQRDLPVPKNFGEMLSFLSGELGEGVRRAKPLNPDTKDCRADVIAWKPFADRRGGQLVVLTQCASGINWKAKLTELNVQLWERYIEFVVSPMRAFAIPFVEIDNQLWLEYGTLGGIAFDRLRIVEMLSGAAIPTVLVNDIRRWGRSQITQVPMD
jgi:hypothetical protein